MPTQKEIRSRLDTSDTKAVRRRVSLLTAEPAAIREMSAAKQHERVAITAYYLAQRRHFEPGHELEDWLAAEASISGFADRFGESFRSAV